MVRDSGPEPAGWGGVGILYHRDMFGSIHRSLARRLFAPGGLAGCSLAACTLVAVVLASSASGWAQKALRSQPADLAIRNAVIYTVDATRKWAEALAVREGRLVYVGDNGEVGSWIGPRTHLVDLGGRLMMPAFHDSHVHAVSGGSEISWCDLAGAKSVEEILRRVKTYAETQQGKPWVLGAGWDQSLFPDGNPDKELLDSAVSSLPVLLLAGDGGHTAWANSKALALAGLTRDTADPPKGRIERDAKGEPSGTLREAAVDLVRRHAPEPTLLDLVEGLRRVLPDFARFGIVSFQEANALPRFAEAYKLAESEGLLTARVRLALHFDETADPGRDGEQLLRILESSRAAAGSRLRAGSVKLFLDGVIEGRTAALLEPYLPVKGAAGENPSRGLPGFEPERLNRIVTRLDRQRLQIHMHAIGDRAIRMGLDALQAARETNGSRDSRHHLAHIQLFHPEDIPRFRRLGAVANFQPFWAYADSYITDLAEPVLGPERSRWLYPIRSLMDSGAVVATGSDWPVTTLNPLEAIQVAVTRLGTDAAGGPGWLPEQRADLARMIAAYTIAGAYLNFEDQDSGSLESGKWADFIVLDKNLFEIPEREIHTAKVLWTMLEGREVYRATGWR